MDMGDVVSTNDKKYSTFKVLEHKEIARLYELPLEELYNLKEETYQKVLRSLPNYASLAIDRPFYVLNGDWCGVVRTDGVTKTMQCFERPFDIRGELKIKPIRSFSLPENAEHTLNMYYFDEYARYEEIRKVYYNRTQYLTSANPNCQHEIIQGYNMSGIRCLHCAGWYCA